MKTCRPLLVAAGLLAPVIASAGPNDGDLPAAGPTAADAAVAAELQGTNRTIQMLLRLNEGAGSLDAGERLRPGELPTRPGAAPRSPAPPPTATPAFGDTARLATPPAPAPAPASPAVRPSDWLQQAVPQGQVRPSAEAAPPEPPAFSGGGERTGGPARTDSIPAPELGAWLPLEWLRKLREHREAVLAASAAVLVVVVLGTVRGSRAGHRGSQRPRPPAAASGAAPKLSRRGRRRRY